LVQRKVENAEVGSYVETDIKSIRGGGQSLPDSVRNFFEPRFGYDFSGVCVHSDAKALELAHGVNARAFTIGRDVVFGAGQYKPESAEGKSLLAHELAHVVQQSGSGRKNRDDVIQRAVIISPYSTIQDYDPADRARNRAITKGPLALGRCDPILNSVVAGIPVTPKWFEDALMLPTLAERNLATIPRPDLNDPDLDPVREGKILVSYGHYGKRVKLIQEALIAWGRGLDDPRKMLPQYGADRDFRGETRAAVKEFQQYWSIKDDGIVGPITLGKLQEAMENLKGSIFTIDTVPEKYYQVAIHIPPSSDSWKSLTETPDFIINYVFDDPGSIGDFKHDREGCPSQKKVITVFIERPKNQVVQPVILKHEKHHETDQMTTINKYLLPWDSSLESLRISGRSFRAPDNQSATKLICRSKQIKTPCELSADIVHQMQVDNVEFHARAGPAYEIVYEKTNDYCNTIHAVVRAFVKQKEDSRMPSKKSCRGIGRAFDVTR
jgi:hypothetical protein